MKKKKFEWKHRVLEDGTKQNALFIDDEIFDWEVDPESIANVYATGDPTIIKAAQQDIARHYLECLSDVVGRKVTIKEIQEAEETGWI